MDKAYYVDSIKYKIDDISSNLEYSDYTAALATLLSIGTLACTQFIQKFSSDEMLAEAVLIGGLPGIMALLTYYDQ